MFRGYDTTDSTNDRSRANPRACSRDRALNSGTSVLKSAVTSITGTPASDSASMSNALRMVSLLAASTARAMGRDSSATMAYDTLFSSTRSPRRSHLTTRLPSACPP